MPWRDVSRINNRPLISILFFIAAAVGNTHVVRAVDSNVGALVCGTDAIVASLTITEPLSDSIVNQPNVTVRGTAQNSSQIEVSVDGAYNSTAAIAADSIAFQTLIVLPEGTHTVSMVAYGVCGGPNATDSIVVTYQPVAEPSSGVITPTELDGTVTLEGEPVNSEQLDEPGIAEQIESIPVFGPVIGNVIDLYSLVGLKATIHDEDTSLVTGVARVGLTIAAVSSVVLASSLAPIAMHAVPGISEVFHANNHRSMIYLEWIIRGVGVLAMTIAYFL